MFRGITISILVALCLSIVLLLAADVAYLSFGSFLEAIESEEIRYAFILSIITSITTTALAVVISVPAAYALSRYRFPGRTAFDVIIDLPIVVPILVIGVSILVFFRMGSDLVESSNILLRIAGTIVGIIADFFVYQKAGIVLAQFYCAVSFSLRTIKAAFDSIDPRTEQVALTLGCSRAQAFWRISLPLARHGIAAGAVLAWARAFGIFGSIAVVAGAVRKKTEVLPTSIFLEISIGRIDTALSVSILMLAVAIIILLTMRLLTGGNIFGTGSRQ